MTRSTLLVLSVLTFASCSPPATLAPHVSEATVGIEATGCPPTTSRGSGVLLQDGLILTAAHVIAGATEVVATINGTQLAATVTSFDPEQDLATLQVETPQAGLAVGLVRVDQDAWVLSFDHTTQAPTSDSIDVLRRLRIHTSDIYLQGEFVRSGLEIGGQVHKGDSGSAIVGADGTVGGIIYAVAKFDSDTGFALDIDAINNHLQTVSGPLGVWGACP